MRVLLVDHDQHAANAVQIALKSSGAVIEHVDSGEEALQLAKRYDYDLMILDLMLPDTDGYEVIRRLRWASINVPVLVLSSLTRPQAKVKAFSLGADDFLARPFDETELTARVQALVRRSKGLSHAKLSIGPIVLDMDSNTVAVSDQDVHLTEKEYRILELLLLRAAASSPKNRSSIISMAAMMSQTSRSSMSSSASFARSSRLRAHRTSSPPYGAGAISCVSLQP
jgi:two-component system cell cycle response regulator CtrA